MSLIDRVKNILKEAPERTPDKPSGLDFEGQSKKFVKNERDKKKTMRKLEPKGSKQGELNLGNTSTTNTPLSTKRTLKGRPLGSKTKSKGETYKQLTTGGERQKQRKTIKKEFKKQQPISDLKKAKKYAAGEYPKIGGGGLKPDIKKPIKGTTPVKTNVSKVNVDKIFSGAGNVKKGDNVPDKNISSKSKGITPVKTNISKVNVDKIFDKPKNPITKTIGVKQSDVSKTQKKFTQEINKANVKRQETVAKRKYFKGRKAERLPNYSGEKPTGSIAKGTYKSSPTGQRAYDYEKMKIDTRDQLKRDKNFDKRITKGLKKRGVTLPKGVTPSSIVKQDAKKFLGKVKSGDVNARKELLDVVDKDFKKMTPAKQSEMAKRVTKIQKAQGRVFDPKTGNFGPSEFQKSLRKAGASGDFSPTMPQDKREAGQKKRDARIKKLKTPDPFKSKTKAKTKFDDIFKGIKKQKIKSGGQTLFDISKTPVGKIELPSPKVSPEAKKKSYDKFAKQISKYSKKVSASGSAIQDLKDVDKATMRTGPIKKGTVPDSTTRYDVGMASRKVTKKYAPGTTGRVQMRGGATNIPPGPKTPPKTYNIPPDDSPGKLAQGRDFPSKKAYDAKLEKQVKILRGKADNLRKKQLKVHKTKPSSGGGRDIERSKSLRKLGARMRERNKTADALERSLKRQGKVGPTSMLPVVSGKGADVEMPGMGGKTYKQFYKDANVGKQYTPPKIKSTPKPDSNRVFNVNRVIRKKAVANVGKSKAGLGLGAKALKFAKGMTLGKAAIGAGLAYAGYEGIKYLTRRKDLSKDEIGTTSTIQTNSPKYKTTSKDKSDPKGVVFKNPTFSDSQKGTRKNREDTGYVNPDKTVNPAIFRGGKSFLSTRSATKQEPLLNKFRNKEFYVTGAPKNKDGSAFSIDKNMRGSAFEKQLKDAQKGTGRGYNPLKKDFLQRKQTRKDRNFLRKYKDAARPTPLPTK